MAKLALTPFNSLRWSTMGNTARSDTQMLLIRPCVDTDEQPIITHHMHRDKWGATLRVVDLLWYYCI